MSYAISYLHFLSFLAYLSLSIYILAKEPSSILNSLCSLAFFCFSIWSFAFIFIHHPALPYSAVHFWINVSAVGGVFYASFLLHFIYLLVFRRFPKVLYLLYGTALLLVIRQWQAGDLMTLYSAAPVNYGWRVFFPQSTISGIIYEFYMYSAVGIIFVTLYIGWKIRPRSSMQKKQCRLMFTGGILVFAFNAGMQLARQAYPISASILADTSFLVWAVCISYAMVKYRLFQLTPITAADQIIGVMSDALFLAEPGGDIAFVNDSAAQVTGYSASELTALKITDLVEGEFTSPSRNIRSTCIQKNQKEIPVLLSSVPLCRRKDEIEGHVVLMKDMTDFDRMEAELSKAQKLEALGVFAGGIAHDLNNMLAGVIGFVDLARMTMEQDSGSAACYLGKARQSFPRLTDLTRQLLTFAKGGSPVKSVVDLCAVVSESASLALSGSAIRENIEIAPDLWPAEIDPGQISQVINNLVINARQAMEDHGDITIRAHNLTDADHPLLEGLPGGFYILLTVSDTGPGIPAELLPRIFDPFVTTKESGSGLGLSTSHSILKRHRGAIRVTSREGGGTTFTLVIPARPEGEIEGITAERKPFTARGKRCLLLDDDAAVREVAAAMLDTFGIITTEASTGEDAVAAVEAAIRDGRPFDFAIFDLTIVGGMGGVEAAGMVKAIDRKLPIIVSSGYSDIPVMENPQAYGFSVVLQKPYQVGALRDAISSVIG